MREAASEQQRKAQADADHAFHATIIEAAGNRMLEHVWQTMRLSITTCVTHARDAPIAARDRRRAQRSVRGAARARSERAERPFGGTSRSRASGFSPPTPSLALPQGARRARKRPPVSDARPAGTGRASRARFRAPHPTGGISGAPVSGER